MRALRFLPLVFLVGADGFALFAPYVIALLAVSYAASRFRASAELLSA